MRIRRLTFSVTLASIFGLLAAGCATQFYGDPKFPGGPRGCFKRCEQAGLEMQSFVFVGEYSTGCVCSLKGKAGTGRADATAAASAGAVGVVLQMREAERQRQASASAAGAHHPAPIVH